MTNLLQKIGIGFTCLAFTLATATANEPFALPEDSTASRPAVDGVNGKMSFAKSTDAVEALGVSGALTIPVGHKFGLQLDGMAAEYDNHIVGDVPVFAAAAHAFWREPSKGLLGLYADFSHAEVFGGLSFAALGIESAIYLDRVSIDVVAGGRDGDIFGSTFFDHARLSYYPTDDLQLHVGHSYAYGDHSLLYGLEWAFAGRDGAASALYAGGSIGEQGVHAVGLGLRFYFGQRDKSLIRRHREDDPPMAPNTVVVGMNNNGDYTIIFGNTHQSPITSEQRAQLLALQSKCCPHPSRPLLRRYLQNNTR